MEREPIGVGSLEELWQEAEMVGQRPLLEEGAKVEARILTSGENVSPEEALEMVETMNRLTRYVATNKKGELNNRLYQAYKYHAILQPSKRIRFVQGLELKRGGDL